MEFNVLCLLFTVAVSLPLTSGSGSFDSYNTLEGCNTTLVCNYPGAVTWINASSSNEIQGSRFNKTIFSSFLILTIIDVSRFDGGNYTCVTEERNATILLEVCFDARDTSTCVSTIGGGDDCTSAFMVTNCKQSCGLCAAKNCSEAVLPTMSTALPSSTSPNSPTEKSTNSAATTKRDSTDAESVGAANKAELYAIVFLLGLSSAL